VKPPVSTTPGRPVTAPPTPAGVTPGGSGFGSEETEATTTARGSGKECLDAAKLIEKFDADRAKLSDEKNACDCNCYGRYVTLPEDPKPGEGTSEAAEGLNNLVKMKQNECLDSCNQKFESAVTALWAPYYKRYSATKCEKPNPRESWWTASPATGSSTCPTPSDSTDGFVPVDHYQERYVPDNSK